MPISIHQPAPPFQLPALHGDAVALDAYRGRPVLLVFLRHLG